MSEALLIVLSRRLDFRWLLPTMKINAIIEGAFRCVLFLCLPRSSHWSVWPAAKAIPIPNAPLSVLLSAARPRSRPTATCLLARLSAQLRVRCATTQAFATNADHAGLTGPAIINVFDATRAIGPGGFLFCDRQIGRHRLEHHEGTGHV